MHNLFSPDSRFMQGLSRAADLMLLNLCFLITCLPVVTVGTAAAALYSVVFPMGTVREKNAVGAYFRAFRENLGCGIRLWLLVMLLGGALVLDMILVTNLGGLFGWLNVPFGILLGVLLLGAVMMFPLMSLFGNTTMGTLKNGLILGLANLPRAAVVLLMWVLPVLMLYDQPVVFFYSGFLWIVIYFSAAAYLSALLLRKVFRPYLPEDMFDTM